MQQQQKLKLLLLLWQIEYCRHQDKSSVLNYWMAELTNSFATKQEEESHYVLWELC